MTKKKNSSATFLKRNKSYGLHTLTTHRLIHFCPSCWTKECFMSTQSSGLLAQWKWQVSRLKMRRCWPRGILTRRNRLWLRKVWKFMSSYSGTIVNGTPYVMSWNIQWSTRQWMGLSSLLVLMSLNLPSLPNYTFFIRMVILKSAIHERKCTAIFIAEDREIVRVSV